MRVRTNRKRVTNCLIKPLLAVTVIATSFIAVFAGTAHANTCSTKTSRFEKGGGAQVCKETKKPATPQKPGTPYKKPSEENKWNTYCSGWASYQSGHVVVLTRIDGFADDSGLEREDQIKVDCRPNNVSSGYIDYLPAGAAPAAAAVDPIVLRDQAQANITVVEPVVASNPSFNEPGRFGVVGIPTWFWLANPWEPLSETSAQGAVSVTVTATPTSVSWNPGDGSGPVTCFDAGVAWVKGLPEEASTCKHTYRSSSADQPDMQYNLSSTINWVFTWSVNGIEQGEFATIQTVTDFTYQVGEIQAVEVR